MPTAAKNLLIKANKNGNIRSAIHKKFPSSSFGGTINHIYNNEGKKLKIITVGTKGHDQIKTDYGEYIIENKSFKPSWI